jgi:hypothetical protein
MYPRWNATTMPLTPGEPGRLAFFASNRAAALEILAQAAIN